MKSLQYYAFCLSFFLPFSYKQSKCTCLCTALNQMLRSMQSLLSKGVTYLYRSTFFAYSIIWLPLPVHRWWRRKKMAALWIISRYSCDLIWMWSVCLRGDDMSWIAHMCLSEACVFKGITSDAWDRWLDSQGDAIAAFSKPIGQLSCSCWQHSFIGSNEPDSLSRCSSLFDANM